VGETDRIWLVTGPNMAGKSTFLRQVALLALMAQCGSFVPADRARIGVVDKLFSRISASDDLAAGRSTFMVEMLETSAILNQATDRLLVILDEVGRGTSTHDGLAIAQACLEHLHDVVGCRTLFATHFHELAATATSSATRSDAAEPGTRMASRLPPSRACRVRCSPGPRRSWLATPGSSRQPVREAGVGPAHKCEAGAWYRGRAPRTGPALGCARSAISRCGVSNRASGP